MRSVQQEKSKADVFKNLPKNKAILIRDWSQKYLPQKNHEPMSEYFGKTGISLHVDVFLTKNDDGSIKKHVYHVATDQSNQDAADTLSVFDVVLKQFKMDNPHINALHIRSDNASAYKSNNVMESLFIIANEYGIQIEDYDFSEAQDGKEQPDREGAVLKEIARSYIMADKTHKITNAHELKRGIMYRGGPKRSKTAIIQMDPDSHFTNKNSLTNISKYHSFRFEKTGYRVWRYYQIGPGKFVKYAGTSFKHNTSILSNFDEWVRDEEMRQRNTQVQLNKSWYCNDECYDFFDTEEELIAHKLAGDHKKIGMKSSKDAILNVYRDLASASVNELRPLATVPCSSSDHHTKSIFFKRGWALPVRAGGRLDAKAKEFCLQKFAEGQKSNKTQYSAEQVVKAMRDAKDPDTNLPLFSAATYLTTKQVKSLLSRFAGLVKKMKFSNNDLQKNSKNIIDIMPVVMFVSKFINIFIINFFYR